jgi:hypothetical protein
LAGLASSQVIEWLDRHVLGSNKLRQTHLPTSVSPGLREDSRRNRDLDLVLASPPEKNLDIPIAALDRDQSARI